MKPIEYKGKIFYYFYPLLLNNPLMNRNIKLTLLALLIPLLLDMMIACCPKHETEGGLYTNQKFYLNHLDNSGSTANIAITDSVIKKAYGIRLHLVRNRVAMSISPINYIAKSTYAGNPVHYYDGYFPVDSIVSFKIISKYDFDENHAAGSEITDYFKVYQDYSFTIAKNYFYNLNFHYLHAHELQFDVDILLMTTPTKNIKHQFKVQLKLSDGRLLEQETTTINLI